MPRVTLQLSTLRQHNATGQARQSSDSLRDQFNRVTNAAIIGHRSGTEIHSRPYQTLPVCFQNLEKQVTKGNIQLNFSNGMREPSTSQICKDSSGEEFTLQQLASLQTINVYYLTNSPENYSRFTDECTLGTLVQTASACLSSQLLRSPLARTVDNLMAATSQFRR